MVILLLFMYLGGDAGAGRSPYGGDEDSARGAVV